MPLYFRAEYWQKLQRSAEKKLEIKTSKIKSVFSGDEQHMILSAYYRQNNYNPVFALRNSLGVLIQIPFFIAAYHYISRLDSLKGISFLFIDDLSLPDNLLKIGNAGFKFNLLPVLMTFINCMSGAVYSKGLKIKEKMQIYIIAAIFLVLLYNSPSGLVLYWTFNNVFSLLKNIFEKLFYRLKKVNKTDIVYADKNILQDKYQKNIFVVFILSTLTLLVLSGILIPSMLIASSPQEFSFIGKSSSPISYIGTTFLQSSGVFIFWTLCLYFIFDKKIKYFAAIVLSCLAFNGMSNLFLFSGDYSNVSILLTFTNTKSLQPEFYVNLANIIISIAICYIIILLFVKKKAMLIRGVLTIFFFASIIFSSFQLWKIKSEYYNLIENNHSHGTSEQDNGVVPVYSFSKTGKNVLIIMLDRAIAGFIPEIFEEKPELKKDFSGFTWYKNTVSYGGHTLFGAPALFGAYEYTPENMQRRQKEKLKQKHNEALLVLPKIFLDNGYHVTVTDPPYANYSWIPDLRIFEKYPEITRCNEIGFYTEKWLESKEGINNPVTTHSDILETNLIKFSFFRLAPQFMRKYLYNDGNWLGAKQEVNIITGTSNNYIALDMLPDLTKLTNDSINTCNILTNDLTHNPAFLQAPDYTLADKVTNFGNGKYSNENHYHVNIAAFLLLGKYFQFLKDNGVYDNTRIIIASDHGFPANENVKKRNLPDKILLPNGDYLVSYAALLMEKDFSSDGVLKVNDTFMTNADVPSMALSNLVSNPVNPFTNNPIKMPNPKIAKITTSHLLMPIQHRTNKFRIKNNEWLTVKDNIFDPNNWTKSTF
jgi:YidC/Oxa1 family membrane protein insertase